jgi:hypothetical protein
MLLALAALAALATWVMTTLSNTVLIALRESLGVTCTIKEPATPAGSTEGLQLNGSVVDHNCSNLQIYRITLGSR